MVATAFGPEISLLRARGEAILCLVHPSSGRLRNYEFLAEKMKNEATCVGIALPKATASEPFELAQLAASYADLIAGEFAEQPLVVLGAGMGAVIAAETTSILCSRGIAPRAFIALESRVPKVDMAKRNLQREQIEGMLRTIIAGEAGVLPPLPEQTGATIRHDINQHGWLDEELSDIEYSDWVSRLHNTGRAYMKNETSKVSVPATLLIGDTDLPSHPRPTSLGWEDVCETLETAIVPGSHYTVLAKENSVGLASVIDGIVNRSTTQPA